MPRKLVKLSDCCAYHVTNRTNNKEWFYIALPEAWNIFRKHLSKSSSLYGVDLHAFVLMSNHFHILLSTPRANLDVFMCHFQTVFSRHLQKASGRMNHVFGGRYSWSLLGDAASVAYLYKYVLRNPVRSGSSSVVEEYRFSSLRLLLNHRNDVPLTERCDQLWNLVPKDLDGRLVWLNLPTAKESEALITTALRRSEFAFSKGKELTVALRKLRETYRVNS